MLTDWDVDQVLWHYGQGSDQVPVVQHYWLEACLRAGRMLGEEDNWGGWRIK
jgi:hypothetical protein